ncbi:hypothetical protein EAI30_02310 [Romboutsia ilealis]|nr:hypothetical protein [Romboutsia ilealis]
MGDVVFIIYISISLIFFVYSIISCKKKSIIYTIRSEKINVLKDDYYNLQLLFCIFNCILLILESVIIYNKTNTSLFVCYYISTFWIINYLLKFIAIKMKYLNTSYE